MKASGFRLHVRKNGKIISLDDTMDRYFHLSMTEQTMEGIKIIKGNLNALERLELFSLEVMMPQELEGMSFYANGFQSWSASPLMDKNHRHKQLAKLLKYIFRLRYYGDYDFNKAAMEAGDSYSHLYLELQLEGRTKVFYGDLKPHDSYTMFSVDYKSDMVTACSDLDGLVLEAGESLEVFKISISPTSDTWFSLLGLERPEAPKITGWTSWYNYYKKITEYILESNMRSITEAGLEIDAFQIDDGYFTHVGDWLEPNDRFPGGMKAMADIITDHGWTPGLWSAPFVTDNSSAIFNEHSNWILRTPDGKLQTAGWNPTWTGIFYALDIYSDDFREYLTGVYDTMINDWGYKLLKLDFLYAAGIVPGQGKTRCRIMADAMDFLLEITDGAKILACGAPLGPAAGKCHYCRIGGDIAHTWENKLLKALNYRERISTAASLGNTVSRSLLNGRFFLNDPDVFILRDTKEIRMTGEEKDILFKTNMENSGLVFFSDDVSAYDEQTLSKVKKAFGHYGDRGGNNG